MTATQQIQNTSHSPILWLPNEMALVIVGELDLPELATVAKVSRHMRDLAYDVRIWQKVVKSCGFDWEKFSDQTPLRHQVISKIKTVWKSAQLVRDPALVSSFPTANQVLYANTPHIMQQTRAMFYKYVAQLNSGRSEQQALELRTKSDELIRMLKKIEKFNTPKVIFALGYMLHRNQRYDQAKIYYEKCIALNADDFSARALVNLSHMFFRGLGVNADREAAEQLLNEAEQRGQEIVLAMRMGCCILGL